MLTILKSSISIQTTKLMERENFGQLKLSSVLLSTLYILMSGFLLYKVNHLYSIIQLSTSTLLQFLFFSGLLFGFITVKVMVRRFIGYATESVILTNELFYSNRIIDQTTGILLLPLMIVAELTHGAGVYPVIIALLLVACGIFIKLYRGLIFSIFENRTSLFQVFLYLCSFEILPIIVLIKFLVINFN